MYIFAHMYVTTTPDFTNGMHSGVACGELCAHIIMNSNSFFMVVNSVDIL